MRPENILSLPRESEGFPPRQFMGEILPRFRAKPRVTNRANADFSANSY